MGGRGGHAAPLALYWTVGGGKKGTKEIMSER